MITFDKNFSWLHFQPEATLTSTSTLIQFWELVSEKKQGQQERNTKYLHLVIKNKLDKAFENVI